MVSEVIGVPQLNARLIAVGRTPPRMLQLLGAATVRESKLLAPRKTSNLSRSIAVTSLTAVEVTITATAGYAAFVEYGTRPHDIAPNAKKALAWAATSAGRRLTGSARKGAAMIFAKLVHHPGTQPHPFMKPGAERAIETVGLGNIVVQAWDSAG